MCSSFYDIVIYDHMKKNVPRYELYVQVFPVGLFGRKVDRVGTFQAVQQEAIRNVVDYLPHLRHVSSNHIESIVIKKLHSTMRSYEHGIVS